MLDKFVYIWQRVKIAYFISWGRASSRLKISDPQFQYQKENHKHS